MVGEEIEFDGKSQPLWPDHCIQGSPGACFAQKLDAMKITETFRKGIDPRIDGHSAFLDNDHRRSTGLNEYLKARGCQWLDIMGLALDVCVRCTVLDALDLGYTPRLITDGCRGMGPAEETLEQLRAAGVEMTTSDKVIRELTNQPQETHL
jgi:nicotinamidase/pyrazinamidase